MVVWKISYYYRKCMLFTPCLMTSFQSTPTAAVAAAEPEAELAAAEVDPGWTHSVEAASGADMMSFTFDDDSVEWAVASGCAIAYM